MNALRKIAQQFATIWNQAGAAQRAALATAGVLLLLATIGVGVWSSRPQYVTLASGLEPTEAAELASLLEAKSIDYISNWSSLGNVSRRHVFPDQFTFTTFA